MKRKAIALVLLSFTLVGCKVFEGSWEPYEQRRYREVREAYQRTNSMHGLPYFAPAIQD